MSLTILAVGAHMDDVEIGVGGILCQAVQAGHRFVSVVVASDHSTWKITAGHEEEVRSAQQQLADVPVADPNELGDYDAIIFGSPTRFGNMTGQMRMDEITGGSPYGAATIVGQNDREPSDNELVGARFQCRHVAAIAAKLAKTEAPVAA